MALDDIALAARAERFAKGGFQCFAAEDLLHLAEDFEKTNTRAARDALSKALTLALQGDDARLLARISQQWESLESNEQNVRQALELSLAASFLWQRAGDFEAWSTNRYVCWVMRAWKRSWPD